MCPYCGEEVPQDSSKCWKCGTELSTSGAARAEGDELEVPDDDEEDSGSPQPLVECPFCGEPVPAKAMRCKECGRTLKRVKSSAASLLLWKWGVWAVVLIVAVSSATAVVIYSQKRASQAERQAKAISAKFETLIERLQPLKTKGFKPEVREEVWEKDFNRKIVHWEGVIDEVDPANHTIKIIQTPNAKKPDVIVTFVDSEDLTAPGLKPGEKIEYSARLVGYGENLFAFTLADGMIDKKQ